MPLLLPVPDADAGGDVDVLRVVRAGRPDGGVLRRVGRRRQTQWGLLCRLPARQAAALRQGLGRGQETVGGQRETGQAGLTARGSRKGEGTAGNPSVGEWNLERLQTMASLKRDISNVRGIFSNHFPVCFIDYLLLIVFYYVYNMQDYYFHCII